jgi:hypothetical protein
LGLTRRYGVRSKEFDRHFDGLRSPRREVGALEARSGERRQSFGQVGVGVVSRGARVRVRKFAALIHHRLENSLISLAEAGQKRTGTGVEQATSMLVDEVDTLSRDNAWELHRSWAIKEDVLRAAKCRVREVIHEATLSPTLSP